MKKNYGFTIIENVVSIAILSILFLLLISIIFYSMKIIEKSNVLCKNSQEVFSIIEKEEGEIKSGFIDFKINGVNANIGAYFQVAEKESTKFVSFK